MKKITRRLLVITLLLIVQLIASTALQADNRSDKEKSDPKKPIESLVTRRSPKLNKGRVEGSIRVLTGESFSVNGDATVTGDIFVPGSPQIDVNSNVTYHGTVTGTGDMQPSDYRIKLNGNVNVNRIVTRSDAIDISAAPVAIPSRGIRDVFLIKGDQPGDFATIRDLTLTRRYNLFLAVPAGSYGELVAHGKSGFILGVDNQETTYHLHSLTLNSNTVLQIRGKVTLNIKTTLKLNSTAKMGSASNLSDLVVNLETGDATLNSSSQFYGLLNAPSGILTMNADSLLVGSVICDRLVTNSNSLIKHVSLPAL